MENKTIARTLRLFSQLLDLHEENPFKVRSIANAAFKVDKLPFLIAQKSLDEMSVIEGIGKSTATKIHELVNTGHIAELDQILAETPDGVVEILQIKGIGPKKVAIIWRDLGIESVGELLYACNENRLIEAKGFGLKTQEEIIKVIEFRMASSGRLLYAKVEQQAETLLKDLQNGFPNNPISLTGDYRRRLEIIDQLDILLGLEPSDFKKTTLPNNLNIVLDDKNYVHTDEGISIQFHFCHPADFGWELIRTTGNTQHVADLEKKLEGKSIAGKSELEIYALAGLDFIEPELREGNAEIVLAEKHQLPQLIKLSDLKGSLHNHSTWSDGVNTLEEMALFCRDELKLEYLGICDHSKSAFYANGLNELRLAAQHREINELNKKLAPFYIFKGIESDILYDGSLDYDTGTLASFDFVVASVHSTLKMTEEKATERLIKAIENPYTTILGHPTGRLLLSRSGYPINHQKVIDACAANGVVIEINANPLRLDLDWRWHQYALEKGVMLAINPDAHRTDGFFDMHYGILVGRKGRLSAQMCLNAMNLDQIDTFFKNAKPA
ncbi:MAG: helix-hairpin-helix domain-containing protein [Sphingobacteriaceae bacterium]